MDNRFDKFLSEAGLYVKLNISIDDMDEVVKFLKGQAKPDAYCIECKENRVFTGKPNRVTVPKENHIIMPLVYSDGDVSSDQMDAINNGVQRRKLEKYKQFVSSNQVTLMKYQCSKDESHKLVYVVLITESFLMKIGQYPSYGDIEIPRLKKFQNVLGKYYKELNKAIGLFSHNVGIGSFVYLRRIIEKLVYDAFEEAKAAGKLNEDEFEYREADGGRKFRNGVEEKIKLLKGYLPDLITDNPKIYGVVSKGIHELSEEECLKYFPVIKDGIILILDDLVAKKEKEQSEAEYRKDLGSIVSEIEK